MFSWLIWLLCLSDFAVLNCSSSQLRYHILGALNQYVIKQARRQSLNQTRHMPPRTSSASSEFIGGSPLQKECCFVSLADIHRKRCDSITWAMQRTTIGEKYFGNPSEPISISRLAEQWLNGNRVFCGLYTYWMRTDSLLHHAWSLTRERGIVDSTPANHDRQNKTIHIFKPELHCLGGPLTRQNTSRKRDEITLPLLPQKDLTIDYQNILFELFSKMLKYSSYFVQVGQLRRRS